MIRFVSWLSAGRRAAQRISSTRFVDRRYRWCIRCAEVASSKAAAYLYPPLGSFFADPFLMTNEGRHFLFFENYSATSGKGVISYAELALDGIGTPRLALEMPYHLSYPMIFSWNDELFMIPETHHNRSIELFRCEDFPDRWVLDKVLFQGISAFDTTLLQHGNKFWLFTCLTDQGVFDYENLYLFHAEDVRGPWTPHVGNPVVVDRSRARPAGKIFERNGKLIRPAQDCSRTYGHRVVFNEIEEMSTEHYAEKPAGSLDPDAIGVKATHTYNCDESFEVTDVLLSYRKHP